MKILQEHLEAMEKEMFQMAKHLKPGRFGGYLSPPMACKIVRMLKIGAWALKVLRYDLQIEELEHLITSVEEWRDGIHM